MSIQFVYLAGPMTGYRHWNFPAFFAAEGELLTRGIDVINPARRELQNGFDPTAPSAEFTPDRYAKAMQWDLQMILASSTDAVVYLPGSEKSTGAQLEIQVARAIGKPALALGLTLHRIDNKKDLLNG